MKYCGFLAIVALLFSCKNEIKEDNLQANDVADDVIVHEEYLKEEPDKPEATELYSPVPSTVTPGKDGAAPSDATILFNGTSLDGWESTKDGSKVAWLINEDGSMTVKNKSGDIQTKQHFGDIQLHIEWKSPKEVQGSGQGRGNSGIFLSGRYEVQVLDNNDNDTYVNGQVGSIYKQHIPLAKASAPTGDWNAYDIIYRAPKFNEDGNKIKSGTVTVLHNGILIQDHVEIKGTTNYIGWPDNPAHGKGPLKLQDHQDNSRVSYRNIWVREI